MSSFGHEKDFWGEDGRGDERYVQWLQDKMATGELQAVHVWNEQTIIGQLEFGLKAKTTDTGYVNLYYLATEFRGKGYAAELDKYVMQYFKLKGYRLAQLSVSPTNARALNFYLKLGWLDKGPRFTVNDLAERGGSQVHLMERVVF